MKNKTGAIIQVFLALLICLALTGLNPQPAKAATCTWTGATSTVYTVATNWDCGHMPLAADDVVIPAATRHPVITTRIDSAYANNFTIGTGGIMEINTGGRFEVYFSGDAINNGMIQTTDGRDDNFFGFHGNDFGSQFTNNGTINMYSGQLNAYFVLGSTHTGIFAGQYGTIGFLGGSGADLTFTDISQITVKSIFFSGYFDVINAGRVYQSWSNSSFNISASNVTIQTTQPLLLGSVNVSSGSLSIIMTTGVGMSALTLAEGAILEGSGTVEEYLINSGTVSPGTSPGEINVSGDYTQEPSGTLEIELGGTYASIEHDTLFVTSLATLDGTLNVHLINDFVPQVGDFFHIVSYGTREGEFATENLPDLPPGLGWQIDYTAERITLTVVEQPLRLYLPVIIK